MTDDFDSSEYTNIGQYIQDQTKRQLKADKESIVRKCIEAGHEHITKNDYESLYVILTEGLQPLLPIQNHNKRKYKRKADEMDLAFAWRHYNLFSRNPSDFHPSQGHRSWQEVLEHTFRTYESVAAIEGIIKTDAQQRIPITEFGEKIGERRVPATSQISGEQELLTEDDYEKITLAGGDTGSGKSTLLELLATVRYLQGEKLFDLHDTTEGENILYDILLQDEELKNIREELGLQNEFQKEREIEVLIPLSNTLDGVELPHQTDGDHNYTLFSIPASELSKDALLLLVDTTDAQRKYLSEAYDLVNGEDDWTLEDLARAVKETGARADVVRRLQSSLRNLQSKNYIRDQKDDHTLDWDRIFRETDVITCLTTMFLEEKAEKIVLTVYIMSKIIEERERIKKEARSMDALPPMSLLIREIHNLAPRTKSTGRTRKIEDYSIEKLGELASYHRHLRMRVIGDAQLLGKQVDDTVSGMAHRIFQFGSQYQSVQRSFNSRVRVDSDVITKVTNYDAGRAALLDGDGYTMPLIMAPPPNYHFDTKEELNGWIVRAEHTDADFAPVDADTTVPERLEFDLEDEEEVSGTPDEEFAMKALTQEEDGFIYNPDLWAAFNTWATSQGRGMDITKSQLLETIRRIHDLDDDDKSRRTYDGRHSESDRAQGYWGITWTEFGESYHDE